jgi:predicted 2-oxoglutarate/Fe(II)-dependent dioxygenase YbiX
MNDFIEIYPNALDAASCRAIVDFFEQSSAKTPSKTGVGGVRNAARRSQSALLDQQSGGALFQAVIAALQRGFAAYIGKFPELRGQPSVFESLGIYRYQNEAEGYDWHSDGMDLGLRYRFVSVILYLNTVTEGGETEFQYQNRKVSATEGTLVFFPSGWTHIHRAVPPRSGPKYVLVTWTRFGDSPML